MCGIIAGTAGRDVVAELLAGLRALEYRGYDSAGFAWSPGNGSSCAVCSGGSMP